MGSWYVPTPAALPRLSRPDLDRAFKKNFWKSILYLPPFLHSLQCNHVLGEQASMEASFMPSLGNPRATKSDNNSFLASEIVPPLSRLLEDFGHQVCHHIRLDER